MFKLAFSLPKYESAMLRLTREVKTGLEKTDSILSQIQTIPVAHDGTTRQVSQPNILETAMKDISVETTVGLDLFRHTDTNKFRDFLWDLYESVSTEMKKHLFEVVSQTTEATGNTFDGQGLNIWDSIIEMTRNMQIHFDENGNHNYSFYVHPETGKRLAKNPPTPEQEREMEEIIKIKKQEFYAQKRTRRLS
jgi:hypothetical protein